MKKLVSALGALALACSANAQTRPPFSFQGISTDARFDLERLAKLSICGKASESGVVTCTDPNSSYAGASALTSFYFYDSHFSKLISIPNSNGYLSIATAFLEKYGPPCRHSTET